MEQDDVLSDEYILNNELLEEDIDESEDEEEKLKNVYEFLSDEIMFECRIMYEKMRYEVPWLLDGCDFLKFFKFIMSYNTDLEFLRNFDKKNKRHTL